MLVKAAERFKGLFICKRFTWPGNPYDLDIIIFVHNFFDQVHGFIRIENFCCDTRAALVHAVKVTNTVVALDIAFRCNRNMTPPECVACFFGKTGVFLDLAHLRRVPLDFLPSDIGNSHFIRHNQHHYVRCECINKVQS